MTNTFVLFITENRYLHHIILPCFVMKQVDKDFYKMQEVITTQTSAYKNGVLSNVQKDLVDIIALYEDKNLSKVYNGKKLPVKKFIETIDEKVLSQNIRPFIDSCIVKSLQIAINNGIEIYICKNNNTNFFEEDKVQICEINPELTFSFEKTEDALHYTQKLFINEKELHLLGKTFILLSKNPCRIIIDNVLYAFDDIDASKLIPFFTKKTILIPARLEQTYFETFVHTAISKFKVEAKGFIIEDIHLMPRFVFKVVKNLAGEKCFFLDIHYGKTVFEHHRKLRFVVEHFIHEGIHNYNKIFRDFETESLFISAILSKGLKLDNNGFFIVDEPKTLYQWISENVSFFDRDDCVLMYENEATIITQVSEFQTELTANNDWFDIKSYIMLGSKKFPFVAFKKHILSGNREFELQDGSIFIIPEEWFSRYIDVFVFGEQKGENISIKKYHITALESLNNAEIKKIASELSKPNVDIEVPLGLQAQLRPYQLQGYQWLCNLMNNNLGACLADDMGLGKTLQTIALLQKVAESDTITDTIEESEPIKPIQQQLSLFDPIPEITKTPIRRKTSLIVMPASLIHNWFNEFRKFTPSLRVLKFAGTERVSSSTYFQKYDVVLTTYGYARNTIDLFASYHFHYIILDESQMIKNPYSKTYESLCRLKSLHRLVLTGTPIENKLLDLWSQMNFINPGMLGNLPFFKETYVDNIEKNNPFVVANLKNIIKPFLLRRHKQDVLTELPEKQEQVVYCKMSVSQEKIYEAEKSKIRNEILDKINQGQTAKKMSVNILQAMLRLRQIANHPSLCNLDSDDGSGKFDEIIRGIENVIDEGHKVLIFSSFVSHLEIIKEHLETTGIRYAYLTGETRNRESMVSDFQKNENIPVFLISIKAGGVGLNLTQADYVFIIDPWWNPAVEEQAISRSHRMGQENKVFVYRFISENTIEEKIQTLQQEKNKLASLIDNQDAMEFSNENVLYLLE